jgi:hypothetical protein
MFQGADEADYGFGMTTDAQDGVGFGFEQKAEGYLDISSTPSEKKPKKKKKAAAAGAEGGDDFGFGAADDEGVFD